jgi:hypothetical protein
MIERRHPLGPSGRPAPTTAPGPDGRELDLEGPARRACEAHERENPAYAARYGAAGMSWCVHDCQYLLDWALTRSAAGFERELQWLTRVLAARDFPLESLARGIELLAQDVGSDPGLTQLAARLQAGAAHVRQTRPAP